MSQFLTEGVHPSVVFFFVVTVIALSVLIRSFRLLIVLKWWFESGADVDEVTQLIEAYEKRNVPYSRIVSQVGTIDEHRQKTVEAIQAAGPRVPLKLASPLLLLAIGAGIVLGLSLAATEDEVLAPRSASASESDVEGQNPVLAENIHVLDKNVRTDTHQASTHKFPNSERSHRTPGDQSTVRSSPARSSSDREPGTAKATFRLTAYEHAVKAIAAYRQGDFSEASHHYRKAIESDSKYCFAMNGLAWQLATCPDSRFRDGKEALVLSQKLFRLKNRPGKIQWLQIGTLAACYAELGDFFAAVELQKWSIKSTPAEHHEAASGRLALYKSRMPYRTAPVPARDIIEMKLVVESDADAAGSCARNLLAVRTVSTGCRRISNSWSIRSTTSARSADSAALDSAPSDFTTGSCSLCTSVISVGADRPPCLIRPWTSIALGKCKLA
jgi:tetratricopeptide (TPR) repeat protein